MNIQNWPTTDKENLFNYLFDSGYRSDRYKIFYVSTPKVACTTLKWWFASLEGKVKQLRALTDSAETDPDLIIHGNSFQRLAPHVTGLGVDVIEQTLESDAYFKFAIVRNPYKRIFSAWQSKLLLQEPLQVAPYKSFEFFNHPLRNAHDIALAVEGFLDHLANNEAPSYWDLHWTPQFNLLRPDLIEYSKVFKIEQAQDLGVALTEWVGEYIPSPFAGRRANESLIPYLPEFVTPRSAALIKMLYARDFETFGYDPEPPESKEAFSAEQLDVALKAIRSIRARHQRLGERNVQCQSLTQNVIERDAQIDNLNKAIQSREEQIASLNEVLTEHDRQLAEGAQLIAQHTGEIAALSQALSERDDEVARLSSGVVERDGQIATLIHSATEKDAVISALHEAAAETGEQFAQLDQALKVREEQIANLNLEAAGKEGQIAGLTQAVTDRGGQIAALSQDIVEKDGQIAWFNQALFERDKQIETLKNTVVEDGGMSPDQEEAYARIDVLAQTLAERDREITALKMHISHFAVSAEQKLGGVQSELDRVLKSRSWSVTAPLRRMSTLLARRSSSDNRTLTRRAADFVKVRQSLILSTPIRKIRASELFDAEYYLANYPDVGAGSIAPAAHYYLFGWKEYRNPSSSFSTERYLLENPDVRERGINPLYHYLKWGRAEGRQVWPASALISATPADYQACEGDEWFKIYDEVDDIASSVRARAQQPDEVSVALGKALKSVAPKRVLDSEVEAITQSGLFDSSYYLAMYPDLDIKPEQAIRHYCERGWKEGRNPSDDFDSKSYLKAYGDIRNALLNPFWHFVVAGAAELRSGTPDAAVHYEKRILFGDIETDIKLMAFFTSPDWAALRNSHGGAKEKSRQLYPHDELGLYEASDAQVLKRQIDLAREHGLCGFCFEMDLEGDDATTMAELFMSLESKGFGFCMHVAIDKIDVSDKNIEYLKTAFADERYVTVSGAPVLVITGGAGARTAENICALRASFADHGGLYLIASAFPMSGESRGLCDAFTDISYSPSSKETGNNVFLTESGVEATPYSVVASQAVARCREAAGPTPVYRIVTLARDNLSQKSERTVLFSRFHIKEYRRWLDAAIQSTREQMDQERRIVFINAWNDWNAGLFLEPDRLSGFSRLNETSRALSGVACGAVMPKVSVIVPNFNHERFLPRRLDSIYGQTYKNIEVILMDDVSSDNSRDVLNHYAALYPDVTRTLFNETNSGSTFRQWAKGIKTATGDLIWIAESDDFCNKRFLEELVSSFEDEAVLLAYAQSLFVTADEQLIPGEFEGYVADLASHDRWRSSYIETAHNEVNKALGVKNTIPNASAVVFRRPLDLPILEDQSWLSMKVAGDWVFYLNLIRGGKVAYSTRAKNFFRRYKGSTAESTYKKELFYKELCMAACAVQSLYKVPAELMEQAKHSARIAYDYHVGGDMKQFIGWYDAAAVRLARENRQPNVLVTTMGFYPGGAEILPIRMANEFKRQGLSVMLLSAGLNPREDGVRRMLRNDVPLIETADVQTMKNIIHDFGIEALNTHQWHIQKYPLQLPDVFSELGSHVASLHGMIEHGNAFGVTKEQLEMANRSVTTWVYTAEKNLGPFKDFDLYEPGSARFTKLPNGMITSRIVPVSRASMGIPEGAFVLCCVSRAIPDKGWAESIASVEHARAVSGQDIRLILVGNGPIYEEYCRTGVPDFVYLAGFSENSVGYYAASDMGIMLTWFKSESFPLTIVDCLFAGKPYIASDVGDIKNMLSTSDDIAGGVIELTDWKVPTQVAGELIAAFAGKGDAYTRAASLVPTVASRYKIDSVARQYIDIFQRDIAAAEEGAGYGREIAL
jgi:uncharacterized protein (DUF3084 family)